MATIIGRQIDVGIGKESVRGTPVAPSFWLPAIGKDMEDTFELAKDEAARGVIETDEDAQVIKRMSEGDIEGLVRDKSIGLLFLNLFGSVVTTPNSPEAGVHTHDFSVAQSVQHPSLTVALKHANENVRFALSMLSAFEMSVELGDFVKYTASFMGKKGASGSDTVSYTTENEFVAQHATVKFATNLAGLAAAVATKVKSVTLSFEKNVETDDVVGSNEPNDILNKEFRVSGTVELLYTDTAFKALAVAGTQQAMRLTLLNTAVTIGASSNPKIEIDLAKAKFEEWSRDSGANDLIRQTLTFEAYYSVTDAKMITGKLINTQASY